MPPSANKSSYGSYRANSIGATSLAPLHLLIQNSPVNWTVLTGNGNMAKPRWNLNKLTKKCTAPQSEAPTLLLTPFSTQLSFRWTLPLITCEVWIGYTNHVWNTVLVLLLLSYLCIRVDPKFLSDPHGSGSVFVIISVADPQFGIVNVSSTVPHKSIIWSSRITSSVC